MSKQHLQSLVIIFFAMAGIKPTWAQQSFKGQIINLQGDPVPYTLIQAVGYSQLGAVSDTSGYFSLTVPGPVNTLQVYISNVAYQDTSCTLKPETLNLVRLEERIRILSPVKIQGQRPAVITLGSKDYPFPASRDSTLMLSHSNGRGSGIGIMYKNRKKYLVLKTLSLYIYNPDNLPLQYLITFHGNRLKHQNLKNYDLTLLPPLTSESIILKANRSGWYDLPLADKNISVNPNQNLFVLISDVRPHQPETPTGLTTMYIPHQLSEEKNLFNVHTYGGIYAVNKRIKTKFSLALVLECLLEP